MRSIFLTSIIIFLISFISKGQNDTHETPKATAKENHRYIILDSVEVMNRRRHFEYKSLSDLKEKSLNYEIKRLPVEVNKYFLDRVIDKVLDSSNYLPKSKNQRINPERMIGLNVRIDSVISYGVKKKDEYERLKYYVSWIFKDFSTGDQIVSISSVGETELLMKRKNLLTRNNIVMTNAFYDLSKNETFIKTISHDLDEYGLLKTINWTKIKMNTDKQPENFKSANNSVVYLESKKSQGNGSGFIISENGYILSTASYGDTKDTVSVAFNNRADVLGIVERVNYDYDLSLIKIDTNNLQALTTSNNQTHNIGEFVYIFGYLKHRRNSLTLSKGVLSSVRKIDERDLLQTDASINEGFEGAPMINEKGEVLGLVSSKVIDFGVEGIGFAIPINIIEKALKIKLKSN